MKGNREGGDKLYKRETARLKQWYKSTELDKGESQMTERDREALKTLGYIQ